MFDCFVTATNTDAGKTWVSRLLLQGLAQLGKTAVAVKPIAAGVDLDGFNTDALTLWQSSADKVRQHWQYQDVNPILLQMPVAPHLALQQQAAQYADLLQPYAVANRLSLFVQQSRQQLAPYAVEIRLIEGAGGWLLPLSNDDYLSDWVVAQGYPVVLVVGMTLGCLNHTMLTARELMRSGVSVLGWVANCCDPAMLLREENIADLTARLPWPRLAVVPYIAPTLAPEIIAAQEQAISLTLAQQFLAAQAR